MTIGQSHTTERRTLIWTPQSLALQVLETSRALTGPQARATHLRVTDTPWTKVYRISIDFGPEHYTRTHSIMGLAEICGQQNIRATARNNTGHNTDNDTHNQSQS